MTFGERNQSSLDDDQFERMLFDSARHDQPSTDVDAFWTRLNCAIDGLARLSAASASAGGGLAFGRRVYRALAAKWLLLGVIAGSALTAIALTGAREWRDAAAPRRQVAAARRAPIVYQPRAIAEVAPRQEALPRHDEPPAFTPVLVPRQRAASRLTSPHSDSLSVAKRSRPDSALGAQVALLDAAQTAVAAGMLEEALRLADRAPLP